MICGFPTPGKNPEYSKETFATYIPKLKEWVYDSAHDEQFNKFVSILSIILFYFIYFHKGLTYVTFTTFKIMRLNTNS